MRPRLALLGLLTPSLVSCGDTGAVTARLVFRDDPGQVRRGLRAAQVPPRVGRLQIEVLGPAGERLGETVLAARPVAGQARLRPEGGTWQIDGVPAGPDRTLQARAFLGAGADPGLDGVLAYEGRRSGIEVRPGEVTDVGPVALTPSPGRPPEADVEAPAPPRDLRLTPDPGGERVALAWTSGGSEDLAGHLVAVSSTPQGITATAAPELRRRARPATGDALGSGFRVATRAGADVSRVEVGDLVEGRPFRVAVYAFDATPSGAPLNWSAPIEAVGTPEDTLPPGAPERLSASLAGTTLRIDFLAPGEDGARGTPARYELRLGPGRAALEGDAFARARSLPAPRPRAPGTLVQTRAELEGAARPAFVAVRAVDSAGNQGPIAVARAQPLPPGMPVLSAARPPIALAGAELRLEGRDLGRSEGTARWVETSTARPLDVLRWTSREVVVAVPGDARRGRVELARPDGARARLDPIGVIARSAAPTPSDAGTLELLGGRVGPTGRRVYALHREAGAFGDPEHAVRRLIGTAPLEPALLRFFEPRSSVVGADYRADLDIFAFVSGGDPAVMTTAVVSGSTLAPDATRQRRGALAGGADGVGLALLPGGTALRPRAFLAFTRAGILRAARVQDLRLEPFSRFVAYTSTQAGYASVRATRASDGRILLALRETPTGGAGRLALWSAPASGDPSRLAPLRSPHPPATTGGIRLLGLPPGAATSSATAVVAHEVPADDGPTRIRVGLAEDWGRTSFSAPLPPTGLDERLEDLGLLDGGGGLRVVILSSVVEGSGARLRWTEVPLARLRDGAAAGRTVDIDVAPEDLRGRLGCKPRPSPGCVAVWAAPRAAQVLFERR